LSALSAKLDALAYGLSLIHEDVRAIRGEHGAMLELQGEAIRHQGESIRRLADTQAEQGRVQAEHGQLLAEILRRLPPPPED
jgi:hypothetical protein